MTKRVSKITQGVGKMTTREFQFIVGPETSVLPVIGSPTEDEDLISLGYANDHYVQGGAPVAYFYLFITLRNPLVVLLLRAVLDTAAPRREQALQLL